MRGRRENNENLCDLEIKIEEMLKFVVDVITLPPHTPRRFKTPEDLEGSVPPDPISRPLVTTQNHLGGLLKIQIPRLCPRIGNSEIGGLEPRNLHFN